MKKINTIIDKLPKSLILTTIIGLLSFACLNIYTLKVENNSIHNIKTLVNESTTEEKQNFVDMIFNMGYKLCKQSTDIIAKGLENEILSSYDLDQLKSEFDNSILSQDFYNVLKDGVQTKKDENILFSNEKLTMVATKEGIIAEFSNTDRDYITNVNGKILSWEEYIKRSSNPKLLEDALYKVLNNKNDIVFIQKNDNSELLQVDVNKLKEIYINDGIEALSNYYFLTASYITEDGDIFGTNDQTFLKENKNYKLIILNTTSIQEVINLFEKNMSNINERNKNILTRIEGYNDLRYISSILGNLVVFLLALWMTTIYNKKIN